MAPTAAPSSKTERTRARLLTAAFELFSRQGYEQTTVAQIAAAAGVTEMTFYRHFGSKVQLLVDDPYDPLIAGAIAEQPVELPPIIRTVRGIRLAWRRLPITDEEPVRERVAIVAATPSLLPALRASTAATEQAISEQLVADGADADGGGNRGGRRHGRPDDRAHPLGHHRRRRPGRSGRTFPRRVGDGQCLNPA